MFTIDRLHSLYLQMTYLIVTKLRELTPLLAFGHRRTVPRLPSDSWASCQIRG